MDEKKENKRICMLYANEYHFELIALSYINAELKQNKEVVILTDKNIEEVRDEIIGKMNFSDSERVRLMELDTKISDNDKLDRICENAEKKKKTTVFIKGNRRYIKEMNEKICRGNSCLKIVDSYDIEELGLDANKVVKDYDTMINMLGEKEI